MMGFMVEGSTGARAVAMLKALPEGTIIETPEFAAALGVKAGALHQLLANAVKLRLVRKKRTPGSPCIGWYLGAGSVGTTIEPRRNPPSSEERDRRRASAACRALRLSASPVGPVFRHAQNWPPGFVSTFESSPTSATFHELRDLSAHRAAEAASLAPAWLRGPGSVLARAAGHSAVTACPRRYIARWHVRYADGNGKISGVVQVLKVHPRLQRVDVWCEWRGQVRSLQFDGFSRIDDAETYKPVDLAKWIQRSHAADPRDAATHGVSERGQCADTGETLLPQPQPHSNLKLGRSTAALEPALA